MTDHRLPTPTTDRVLSVDVLRASIILLMVFVNDVWTSPGVPGAFLHAAKDQDAMTLADLVYPAFLFIVGVSIPLAFERSRQLGTPLKKQLRHIVVRTGSLLIMGLFMVNMSQVSVDWPEKLWSLLFLLAFIGTWLDVPKSSGEDDDRKKQRCYWAVKVLGAASLVVLALFYRDETGQGLQHRWWGILGQIGWAYLYTCLLYLFFGPRREWLLASAAIFMASYYGDQAGLYTRIDDKPWLDPIRSLVDASQWCIGRVHAFVRFHGSLYAITVCGAALGTTLNGAAGLRPGRQRLTWAANLVLLTAIGALVLDSTFGINKIRSTPSWCLWSIGFTTLLWMVLYALIDLAGWAAPARWLQPVGANPLLAYFLHPILIHAMQVSGFTGYQKIGEISPTLGVLRSTLMVIFIAVLTGILVRLGVRVRV